MAALRRHIEAINDLGDGLRHCAVGTDLDGFITPTLSGIDQAGDLATLAQWIEEDFPDDADGILYGNAQAMLRRILATQSQVRGLP